MTHAVHQQVLGRLAVVIGVLGSIAAGQTVLHEDSSASGLLHSQARRVLTYLHRLGQSPSTPNFRVLQVTFPGPKQGSWGFTVKVAP